jgi:thiosulfate/3-mercaptopyruvate sulfurtransferase
VELPGPLVSGTWAREHLGDSGLVLVDVRWHIDGDARAAYESGHLPGAVFLDADRDLAARAFVDGPGRHPLPGPELFANTMATAGIGDGDAVVAYDDVGGSYAARLWWMLSAIGHACAVLDGALQGWEGPLETGAVLRPAATFVPVAWPQDRIAGADAVSDTLRERSEVVLDARAGERYRGEVEPIDPKPGHIPGAVSAPWASNLDPETGRFLPPGELRRRYEALGVRDGSDPVAYCGSGLTATHDLLALTVAGLGPGRLYEGSWSGWISDPARAMANGEEAGQLPAIAGDAPRR